MEIKILAEIASKNNQADTVKILLKKMIRKLEMTVNHLKISVNSSIVL